MALADPAGIGGEREGRVIGDTLGVEAKLALDFVCAVAGDAVLFQHRLDEVGEDEGPGRVGDRSDPAGRGVLVPPDPAGHVGASDHPAVGVVIEGGSPAQRGDGRGHPT